MTLSPVGKSLRFLSFSAGALMLAGCASNPSPEIDPLFTAVPGGQYECYAFDDSRSTAAKAVTNNTTQSVAGGVAGGMLASQIGSGSGRDIATGVGAVAGAAAGNWNANRMRENRLRACEQQRYRGSGNAVGY